MPYPVPKILQEAGTLALPAILHLRCPDCEGSRWIDLDHCAFCGGYGHFTFGITESEGELWGWHFEDERMVSFNDDDDARNGHVSRSWKFTGTLRERRVLDAVGVPHGSLPTGAAYYECVSWRAAVARAKGGGG